MNCVFQKASKKDFEYISHNEIINVQEIDMFNLI
jgi:hypothetical protein